jgi:zinc transporter ZupT
MKRAKDDEEINLELLLQTAILTFGMLAVCSLPLVFKGVEKWSALIFLFGTGALLGVCAFDLLPDVIAIGGPTSLSISILVGVGYCILHIVHLRYHQPDSGAEYHHHHVHSFSAFFSSLVSHCFASGMLLTVSRNFSGTLSSAVFLALLAHKGYESLVLISVVLQQQISRLRIFMVIGIYCLALPFGAGLAYLLQDKMSQIIAMYITSFAVGSLLGCLIFDFVIPSYHQVRRRWLHATWVLLGLVLTGLIMGHA